VGRSAAKAPLRAPFDQPGGGMFVNLVRAGSENDLTARARRPVAAMRQNPVAVLAAFVIIFAATRNVMAASATVGSEEQRNLRWVHHMGSGGGGAGGSGSAGCEHGSSREHERALQLHDGDNFPTYTATHRALAARLLRPALYASLRPLRTRAGYSLDRALQCGVDLPHLRVGFTAGDAQSYALFAPLLDPLVAQWHGLRGLAGGGGSGGARRVTVAARQKWPNAVRSDLARDAGRLVLPAHYSRLLVGRAGPLPRPPRPAAAGVGANGVAAAASAPVAPGTAAGAAGGAAGAAGSAGSAGSGSAGSIAEAIASGGGGAVLSTRVRAGRSLGSFRFPPSISRSERRALLQVVGAALRAAFPGTGGKSAGALHELATMPAAVETHLRAQHMLFQRPGPTTLLAAAGAARDWPDARAIWVSSDERFLVWVNEEDHMRTMAMAPGGDVAAVFGRWAEGTAKLEAALAVAGHAVAFDPKLGFLATCPSNLGTAMRASVFVRLPRLAAFLGSLDLRKHPALRGLLAPVRPTGGLGAAKAPVASLSLEVLCARLGLQARGSAGEHSASAGGLYDVSNHARMGATELQLVQGMVDGVALLVGLEAALAKGAQISADGTKAGAVVTVADDTVVRQIEAALRASLKRA
jgi:creatine kinase